MWTDLGCYFPISHVFIESYSDSVAKHWDLLYVVIFTKYIYIYIYISLKLRKYDTSRNIIAIILNSLCSVNCNASMKETCAIEHFIQYFHIVLPVMAIRTFE